MSWLPIIGSLLLGVITEFNGQDFVAQNPDLAIAVGTAGLVIKGLLPSPVK